MLWQTLTGYGLVLQSYAVSLLLVLLIFAPIAILAFLLWRFFMSPHDEAPLNYEEDPDGQAFEGAVEEMLTDLPSPAPRSEELLCETVTANREVVSLMSHIDMLQEVKHMGRATRMLRQTVHTWCLAEEFRLVNSVMGDLEISQPNIDLLIVFLSTTHPWKREIPGRDLFYSKVQEQLEDVYSAKQVEGMLEGLK